MRREPLSIAESGLDTLALDWMPEKWRNLIFGKAAKHAADAFPPQIFRASGIF